MEWKFVVRSRMKENSKTDGSWKLFFIFFIIFVGMVMVFIHCHKSDEALIIPKETAKENAPFDMEESALITKSLEHAMTNLDRLINIRFWLYAFYFAMISALLTLFSQSKNDFAGHRLLIMFAAVLGQLVIILQLIISSQIAGNYNGIHYILGSVDFIRVQHAINDSLKSIHKIYFLPEKYPYLLIILFLSAANTAIFLYGIGAKWLKEKLIKLITIIVFSFLLAYSIFVIFSMRDFRSEYHLQLETWIKYQEEAQNKSNMNSP